MTTDQMDHSTHTALVTGANSGFGFEAAAQLAEAGYRRVILACRTLEKASDARTRLVERTGRDIFDVLAIDVAELESSASAAQEVIDRPDQIDLLVLNAGLTSQTRQRTTEGVELTIAAGLFGHHVLTMKLLEAGKLSPQAHIVIAGSEGARGEMPGLRKYDYGAIQTAVGGDLDAAMDAVARGEQPAAYKMNRTYGNAKLWVVWWAAAVTRQLPQGVVAIAVSPGSSPGTNFGRDMSAVMRLFMIPMLKLIGPLFKMAGPVTDGAKRYVDAGEFGAEASGKFYASPPGKLVGPMEVQQQSHFYDRPLQDAAWRSVVRLTGVGMPEVVQAGLDESDAPDDWVPPGADAVPQTGD